jgi:transcriptional repressor NrdR
VDCPACQAATRVLETRRVDGENALRRRRECTSCGQRFTTFERFERGPLYVRKRNGQRQRFDRVKLRAALLRAAHKRPVSATDVEALIDRVEIAAEEAGGELTAQRVGELCLQGLRNLDGGAYLQFAGTLPGPIADFAGVGSGDSVRPAGDPAELPRKAG